MTRLNIKPLSANEMWQGKRFRSPKYKSYSTAVLCSLPKITIPEGKLEIHYKFGFSSHGSDLDNPTKGIQDLLSQKYGFNDNRIWRITIDKEIVPKGQEYIEFEIKSYDTQL